VRQAGVKTIGVVDVYDEAVSRFQVGKLHQIAGQIARSESIVFSKASPSKKVCPIHMYAAYWLWRLELICVPDIVYRRIDLC
jgi:hypothetical protein